MKAYLHPQTAVRLLAYSRTYRVARHLGFDLANARALAEAAFNLAG